MFDSRRKGLGAVAAEETTSEPWVKKNTKSGDTLAKLAEVYGVSAKEIALKNGVRWTTAAINNWVKGVGGKLLSSGWYVFTNSTAILLPPTDRRDGEPAPPAGEREPPSTALAVVRKSPAAKLVVALGLAGAAAMLLFSKKENKAKGR